MRNQTCHAQPVRRNATPTSRTLSDHASLVLLIWPELDGHPWPDQVRIAARGLGLTQGAAARALGELIHAGHAHAELVTT